MIIENEILNRARFLAINEYPRNPRDCILQALDELSSFDDLSKLSREFDCTIDEYIDSLTQLYYNIVSKQISSQWK